MRPSPGALALALLSIFVLLSSAFSQDLDDVVFSGRITDSNGQSIVGATITLTAVNSGVIPAVVFDT